MAQCLNIKLSNSQLNKLKSSIKNKAEVLILSSNMIGNSDDKTNFPHKLLLINRQVVVVPTAQLHSTKSELRFRACSNPARRVSEIRDDGDL